MQRNRKNGMGPTLGMATRWTACAAGALGMLLAACGDDATGAPDAGAADAAINIPDAMGGAADAAADAMAPDAGLGPEVRVIFPPPRSVATSSEITVRGTAADADGVAAIRVNGVAAETGNDFVDWHAIVPLVHGQNRLIVESESITGRISTHAAEVLVTLSANPALSLQGLALDEDGGRLLATNGILFPGAALLSIDLGTGERRLLSGAGAGTGPAMQNPGAVVWDAAAGHALVGDTLARVVLAIDVATGDRSVFSGAARGSGPTLNSPVSIALDPANERVLVGDDGLRALVAVAPATGDRQILSDGTRGSGPAVGSWRALALDPARERVLVADASNAALVAVDLATGDRQVLSGGATGDGPALAAPIAVMLDATGSAALVTDQSLGAVLSIELDTGHRTRLSGADLGTGPQLARVDAAVRDPASGRVLVTEATANAVFAVDLATGDRSALSDFHVGSGAHTVRGAESVAWDVAGGRIFVSNEIEDEEGDEEIVILAIDVATGARTVLSDGSSGPDMEEPSYMLFDGERLLVADGERGAVLAVDPATGARSLVSGGGVGSGPSFFPIHLTLDPAGDRLFVIDGDLGALVTVSLPGGNRTILSGGEVAVGPLFTRPRAVIHDEADPRALVADVATNTLYAVDLVTGTRSVAFGPGDIPFTNPAFAVLDQARHRMLVIGRTQGLWAMDLTDGARTMIANASAGRGPFGRMDNLALDAERELAAVLDSGGLGAVLIVDLRTGDRVLLSR